ncbi:MAG: OmpA family protein, partial [Nevskia sp.]|nr:OmpA family protein [Nevskia sp.]
MSKLRFGVISLAIAAGFGTQAAGADESDHRFYVAPMGSFTLGDRERGSKFGYGGELALGKRVTNGLELELIGTFTNFKVKQSDFPASAGSQPGNAKLYGYGGGVNLYLDPSSNWLGGLFLHLDVQRGEGRSAPGPIRSYGTTLFDAGLGYNFELTHQAWGFLPAGVALRAEALYRQDAHGKGELGTAYGNEHKYFQEAVFNIGLRIPLGAGPQPAAEPSEPPTEVVPVEEPPAEAPPPAPPPCEPPQPGQPISLEGCKLGDTIVLRGVNFEFNKDNLTVNAKSILDGVADALKARTDIKVEIDGHTDSKGSDAYNQKLSERRAASVKRYLLSRGIDAGRMSSKGFGESKPIADNNTDEGREINRRVELTVTDADASKGPVQGGESVPTSGAMDTSTPPADTSSAPAAD